MSASLLLARLVTLRPERSTPFEAFIIADDVLMRDISLIADDTTPQCIWRKRGRTAHLFMFLADRFLGAPDSVGGCESIHAQWKWLEVNRRSLTLQMLNALLKLRNYVTEYTALPDYEHLVEHISAINGWRAALYNNLSNDPNVARSSVRSVPYLERFNLRAADLQLVAPEAEDDASEAHDSRSVHIAWANYVRFLFAPHNVYCFTGLPRNVFFYVAENKSVAYRDAPKQGEAIGRAISVIWLEMSTSSELPDCLGAARPTLFVPASDGADGELHIADISLAEISLASGYYPPDVAPHHSDRDVELMHEQRLLQHAVERFASMRTPATQGAAWSFIVDLDAGECIEFWNYENRDMGDHTKMSLARQLQERDGLTDDVRDRAWALPRATLVAALAQPAAAGAVPALLAARGRGRGALAGAGGGGGGAGVGGAKGRGRGRGVLARGRGGRRGGCGGKG